MNFFGEDYDNTSNVLSFRKKKVCLNAQSAERMNNIHQNKIVIVSDFSIYELNEFIDICRHTHTKFIEN